MKNLVDKAEEFKLYCEIVVNGMTTFIFYKDLIRVAL